MLRWAGQLLVVRVKEGKWTKVWFETQRQTTRPPKSPSSEPDLHLSLIVILLQFHWFPSGALRCSAGPTAPKEACSLIALARTHYSLEYFDRTITCHTTTFLELFVMVNQSINQSNMWLFFGFVFFTALNHIQKKKLLRARVVNP